MTKNRKAGKTAETKTYTLAVVQILRRYVEIEAESGDAALSEAERMVEDGSITLGMGDLAATEVQPVEE